MSADMRAKSWSRMVTGLIILAAGVIFWLDKIDRLDARDYIEWWPLALVAIGLGHLAERRLAAAAVWIGLGVFFMLPMLGFDRPSVWLFFAVWPLLISAAGVTLIVQALRPRPAGPTGSPGFRAVAVMAGNVRRIVSPTTGGEAVAVMGGCELEIAPQALFGNEMIIDVLTFWGGINIRIPYGWQVVDEVAPILGGLEDKTAEAPPGAPRLIVRGSAIMAGVEVRNHKDANG
jgi:hypothetical protein